MNVYTAIILACSFIVAVLIVVAYVRHQQAKKAWEAAIWAAGEAKLRRDLMDTWSVRDAMQWLASDD